VATLGLFFLCIANRRRQRVERDAIIFGFFIPTWAIIAAAPGLAPAIVLAAVTALLLPGLFDFFVVAVGGTKFFVAIIIAVEIFLVAATFVALRLIFLLTDAMFFQDTEIMFRILQIIFRLNPVAGHLRITREALIFFQKLRGIATLAIILAVATTGVSLSSAAATAALTIVDQK